MYNINNKKKIKKVNSTFDHSVHNAIFYLLLILHDFSVSDTSVYVLIPRSGGRLNGKST